MQIMGLFCIYRLKVNDKWNDKARFEQLPNWK